MRNNSSVYPSDSVEMIENHRFDNDYERSTLAVDMSKRMLTADGSSKRYDRRGRRTTVACVPHSSMPILDDNGIGAERKVHHQSWSELSTSGLFRDAGVGKPPRSRAKRVESSEEIFLEDIQDEDLEPSSFPSPSTPLRRDEEMSTLFFRDGLRKIDFVLAYEDSDFRRNEYRDMFQKNLRKAGLELEIEDKSLSQDGKTYFLKIHAPYTILRKHAEVLNIKRPIKHKYAEESFACEDIKPEKDNFIVRFFPSSFRDLFSYDRTLIPDDIDKSDQNYSGSSVNGTLGSRSSCRDVIKYTDAQRSRIVWEILIRTPHHGDGRASTGVLYLVSNGTYTAAYPLHDGPYGKGAYKKEEGEPNLRRLLYSEWARFGCWYKRQPLCLIRRYFGEKTALYFAWLGFYTTMLIPAAFLGLFTMIYGISTMKSNIPSKEICDPDGPGSFPMCPQCDKRCDYWTLKDGCLFSQIVHLFDNAATVGFAVFMSLWATMFMEFWKRKQATLAWEWNLADLDYGMEQIRPEYESTVKNYRLNPVTMAIEPFLPFWSKVYRIAAANSAVLFVLSLLLATVFGLIVYRIILVTVLTASDHHIWKTYAKITTSITASLVNLVVIVIMDKVYRELTAKLTNLEQPRTQREYEDSFTFKMFLFEFINMYSSLIYIAFFKGRFFGHPGQAFTLFGFRQDQCELGGCLFEVCVQLAIIMVGKQILNNISELSWAEMMNWWKRWWRTRDGPKDRVATTRWEIDYNLLECDRMALFDEYLEMVIQFGFVTLFVAAFPLAPLFALLNNIVEIRLDAYKYVTQLRRPLSARVPNIGAWQAILKGLSVFAVISNAFMIAYTSDFIPRLVYMFVTSKNRTLDGYIDNSLSLFNTSDFSDEVRPDEPMLGDLKITVCRYQDYRNPPNHTDPYQLNMRYWHIFAARLSFVVVFEHLVFFITSILAYMIPDIPKSVQQKIMRKRHLAREALYRTEAEEARTVLETTDETLTGEGDSAILPC
ncbi:anoctamin-4-like isoform X2 [Argiope bruennichi]|uniref:anoctamin-4-like isoform X2 n=1 Tax=Argiope bruennichi TaxID=94029 RepID=UPI0024952E3E|nr:anoctamin-4-like isoform X2 [Argiope bruennichi]